MSRSGAEVEDAFQSAIAAMQTAQEDYGRRLAIVFAKPCFPKSELPEAPIGLAKWKQAVEAVTRDCKALYWRGEESGGRSEFSLMSLSRLWQRQRRRAAARELLAEGIRLVHRGLRYPGLARG